MITVKDYVKVDWKQRRCSRTVVAELEKRKLFLQQHYYTKGTLYCEVHLGLSRSTIYTWVKRFGILDMTAKLIYMANWNVRFFDEWSHEMAYVLGFVFADGSLSDDGTHQLSISQKSRAHLLAIADLMQIPESLIYPNDRILNNKRYPQWRLRAASKYASSRLVELGIRPRKSFDKLFPFPVVPEKFLGTFLLGYFDGDGSIYIGKERITLCFSGQKPFLEGIRRRLIAKFDGCCTKLTRSDKTANCWKYSLSSKPVVLRVADWLYADAPIYLERKRIVFDQLKASK